MGGGQWSVVSGQEPRAARDGSCAFLTGEIELNKQAADYQSTDHRPLTTDPCLLEARHITVSYGSRIAVAHVSLRAVAGEVTAIVGPNGAGKSTLLRTLNGALVPISGGLLLDGMPLGTLARRAIGRRIAVVAQEAELRFPVTVMEFVLGGRYAWSSTGAWGWESDRDVLITRQVLRETELEEFSGRLMSELSGGERQRAVLARALATEAGILLLDEPTANLDLAHQAALLRLVRARCDEERKSAVVVTHDINLASEFADNVLLLFKGRTVAAGSPREVFTEDLLRKVFEIKVLVDAHPVTGAPRITPVHDARRESQQPGEG
ncbi:MAG: cobalamin transport system ATP-binding protein [Acidobacteriota bacterium]|nr:cobalamin transport system ATP-binding protein [Acidobacteriota bacterium]